MISQYKNKVVNISLSVAIVAQLMALGSSINHALTAPTCITATLERNN